MPTTERSAEWMRVTLSCIGDGVITTDAGGRVTFLNPVAEALTGWTREQATEGGGMVIERVFHIVSEATRAEVENPTVRTLREGVIVGLGNHTLLISRDGTERPISDSAAPIKGAGGETIGAVLVFRDATESHAQERRITDAKEYAENILETQREPFLVLDERLRIVSANRAFYKLFRAEKSTTEGRFVYDLGDGQWNIPKLRELLEGVVPRDHAFEGFEVSHDFPGGVGRKTVLLNVRRIQRQGNHSVLILLAIEDITARRAAEAILDSQRAVLELAAAGGDLQEVLDLLVSSAQRHGGDRCRVCMFLLDPDGTHLRFAAAAGMNEAYTRAVDNFEIGPRSPSCGTAAFTGHDVIVRDVAEDPLWAPLLDLAREHEIRACWSHPMRSSGGTVLGTIAMYHREPREPGPGDLEVLRLLGHTATLVIERHRESEQRRETEATLQRSETRFRRLFQTAKDGILILDANTGKITDANAFMNELVGVEQGELLGKELYEIGMFKDIEENKAAFRELQRTGYIRHGHLPVLNRRGERAEVEFIANVYREGDTLVAQCNVRDISERSRLETELAAQSAALAAQARAKDEFLAMLSHELRNPLAPIRAAAHMMRLQERDKGAEGNPVLHQAREVIERQVANLTKMVSDLSEVSRVINGRIRLDLQNVDMNRIVEHAVQTVAPLFEQRRHSVSVRSSPDPVWVHADPVRLEEVLVNLLNNAAKYTPDGGHITVACEQQRERGAACAIVRVKDNGVGIEASLLPRVFDLFTQADRSLDRSWGGLGIGLSLAQRLMTLHGGTITARSAGAGLGSEFAVKLSLLPAPLADPASGAPPAHAEPSTPAVAASQRAQRAAMRVLVVDDNVDLVTMLCGALRHKGFVVKSAYTGPEGLQVAQDWRPHIALLDIGLPGLDGYEIARRLRADDGPSAGPAGVDPAHADGSTRMKLIAITGYGRENDIELAREAGFDGHLVKPCDMEKLEAMMAEPGLSIE